MSAPRKSPKRDRLVENAFRLFYREGFQAAGIDAILAQSGVAKMTLYHHFPSKEALVVAALQQASEAARARRDRTLADAGPDPERQLAALFDAYQSWFADQHFNGCAFNRALGEFPDSNSPIHQTAQSEKQALLAHFHELAAAAGARQPSELASSLFLLLEGAVAHAHAFRDPTVAERAKTAAIALLHDAALPEDDALPTHLL